MESSQPILEAVGGAANGTMRLLRDVLNADVCQLYEELRLLASHGSDVVIECQDADYLCGAAWQMMLSLQIELATKSAKMLLLNVPAKLHRGCQLLGFDQHLPLRPLGAVALPAPES